MSRNIPKNELVTVILPTKNEEEAIGSVIDEIRSCGFSKIIVIDGHSSDKTVQIARERGIEVVLQTGKGKRDAIVSALEFIKTPYCLFMDADMTYDAHDIDAMMQYAADYDQVIGVRRPQPDAMNGLHRFGNSLLTAIYNLLFGVHLSDVLSGMYILDAEFARSLQFDLGELTVEQEILAQSTAMGRVKEVQINYRKRMGTTKVHTWRQGFMDLLAMLSIARRYSPVILFSMISAAAIIPAGGIMLWILYEAVMRQLFHSGYAALALFLFIIGAQGLTVSSLSVSMKLTLRQFERRLRRELH